MSLRRPIKYNRSRMKTRRRRRSGQRKQHGGGKATLSNNLQPDNPYPKGSLERAVFGKIVSTFYYARGPYPDDVANEDGYVPLTRILCTRTFRNIIENNPLINIVDLVVKVIEGAFAIKYTEDGPAIKALPWPKVNKNFL